MFRKQSEIRGSQTAFIDEMISGQKVVKAFGQEEKAVQDFDEINDELAKYYLKGTFFSSITNPSTRFVNNIVYAGVAISGGLVAIMTGGITVGGLATILSYANQYTKPFNEISGVVTELQNALACAAEYLNLLKKSLRFLMLKMPGLLKRLTEQLILMMYAFPMYLTGSLLRTSIFMSRRDRE